jgi:hypothetical protein
VGASKGQFHVSVGAFFERLKVYTGRMGIVNAGHQKMMKEYSSCTETVDSIIFERGKGSKEAIAFLNIKCKEASIGRRRSQWRCHKQKEVRNVHLNGKTKARTLYIRKHFVNPGAQAVVEESYSL